ncbi:hypothetical protein [Methanobrevibacter sp.]|uniref:hypothetical protein n=1 Tax=Methanobrevibacter sp. TaxID=66852 RepID=UPI003870909F
MKKNTNNSCIPRPSKILFKMELDFVICSYAMHLCKKSILPILLYRIGEISNNRVIITPHKKPNCNGGFFREIKRMKKERTSIVWYRSKMVS